MLFDCCFALLVVSGLFDCFVVCLLAVLFGNLGVTVCRVGCLVHA